MTARCDLPFRRLSIQMCRARRAPSMPFGSHLATGVCEALSEGTQQVKIIKGLIIHCQERLGEYHSVLIPAA